MNDVHEIVVFLDLFPFANISRNLSKSKVNLTSLNPLTSDVIYGSSLSTFATRSSIHIDKAAKMLCCLGSVDLEVEHGNVSPGQRCQSLRSHTVVGCNCLCCQTEREKEKEKEKERERERERERKLGMSALISESPSLSLSAIFGSQ